MSTACTHPHEKLGEELRCALSYLTTAPAASEMGTWNLGNEDRGVKFVSTARAQSSGRPSFFSRAHLAHSYIISLPHFMTYINNPFPVVLWRGIKYWPKLESLSVSCGARTCSDPIAELLIISHMLRPGPVTKFSSNQSSKEEFAC